MLSHSRFTIAIRDCEIGLARIDEKGFQILRMVSQELVLVVLVMTSLRSDCLGSQEAAPQCGGSNEIVNQFGQLCVVSP